METTKTDLKPYLFEDGTLDETAIADDVMDGFLLRVGDLAEIPDDYIGDALVINDHGNATLYFVEGETYLEHWSLV
jgi:hypothetical protein